MSLPAGIDPNLPVIVGVGQLNNRVDRGDSALEPIDLLAQAARLAACDALGSERSGSLFAAIDTVAVIEIFSWPYSDPAALLSKKLGIEANRRWHTGSGGNYPQRLLNLAAADIQAGRCQAVLIGGAEAWRTRSSARKAGETLSWTRQDPKAQPTESFGVGAPLVAAEEIALGLVLPVQFYPLFESAIRAAAGTDQSDHRAKIAELWSRFSAVAHDNSHAWIRRGFSAEEISTVNSDNRMVCHPYPKLMNANNSVEQSAAFIVCSARLAADLNIGQDKWVFPWVGTHGDDTDFVGNRVSFHRSPALGIAGNKALELAGVEGDALAHIDLYSCFPSAVEVAATELNLDLERKLTVTGGLSFAGGPWNNYVTHSIATMAEVLRADAGAMGLVTANGGFLTKHAFGVYSSRPPSRNRFVMRDCQAEVDAVGSVELVGDYSGQVEIEAATVSFDRDGVPETAFVAGRTPDRRRAWARSSDVEVIDLVITDEPVGVAAERSSDGEIKI